METVNKRGRKKREANYNNIFSVRLRELINQNEVTQQEISENITASRQALNKWVNGETVPDILAAAELADYFEVSLDYLTGRGTVKSPDADIVVACDFTGLNEESIKHLRYLTEDSDSKNASYILDALILSLRTEDLYDISNLLLLKEKTELFEIEFVKKYCKKEGMNIPDKKIDERGIHIFAHLPELDIIERFNYESKCREEKLKAISDYSLIDFDLKKDPEFEEFKVIKRVNKIVTDKMRLECYELLKDNVYKQIKDYYAKALELDPQSEDLGFLAIENFDMLKSI